MSLNGIVCVVLYCRGVKKYYGAAAWLIRTDLEE